MQFFYAVRPGDTLYQIAKRWALPLESLIAANNLLPPYTIYAGQQLSIPPGVNVVRVKPGDTVFNIAQFFGVPPAVIVEANRLQPPYLIEVGQLLNVPPGVPYYVVQPGDTLFQIASRFHVTTGGQSNPSLIQQVNQLSSDLIFPGMRLVIPYAPPGDTGVIAYTSNRGGTYDIWLYNPDNGTNRPLTNGVGAAFSMPFWSPNSTKIAFIGKEGILYVVQLATNAIARIDQIGEEVGSYISWSPDSQKIAYVTRQEIIIYHIAVNKAQRIKEPAATDVQWFPGGMELLFQAPDAAGISQLYRVRTDGTGKRMITQNTGSPLHHVRLSPDGSHVLYTSPGVSISIIYSLNLLTGRVAEVRGGPLAKNYFPVWSPDSTAIAYSATAFEKIGYFSLIKTVGKQGENDQTSAISDCFATPVTWSPDSRKLAYLSRCHDKGMASEMWVIDLLHPVPIQLVKGTAITALQWSPLPISLSTHTYTNTVYRAQLQYPGHWKKVTDERYEGLDGFFQIAAIASEERLHAVCHNEAYQQLLPYGSKPRIFPTSVQQQEACVIFPSEDQPAEMRGQAALIVRYPQPLLIGETLYQYLTLWVDQDHLQEISKTLTFLR